MKKIVSNKTFYDISARNINSMEVQGMAPQTTCDPHLIPHCTL